MYTRNNPTAHPGTILGHPLMSIDPALSTITSGEFVNITDGGSIGSTLDGVGGALPQESTLDVGFDRSLPLFGGGDRFRHAAAASNFTRIHDGSGDATLSVRFYLPSAAGTGFQTILCTYDTTNGNVGFSLFTNNVSGTLRLFFGNGTAKALELATAGQVAAGMHSVVITRSGNDATMTLDGATRLSGTLSSPSSSAPMHSLAVGANDDGSTPLTGNMCEAHLFDTAATRQQELDLISYYDRWTGTPV